MIGYRDVAAAGQWLCRAFGFSEDASAADDDGVLIWQQLRHGSSRVMLVNVGATLLGGYLEASHFADGGRETQMCHLLVADVEVHYQKAKSAGAELIVELQRSPPRPSGFVCRDIEGHIWSFGEGRSSPNVRPRVSAKHRALRSRFRLALAATSVMLGIAFVPYHEVSRDVATRFKPEAHATLSIKAEPKSALIEAPRIASSPSITTGGHRGNGNNRA